MLTEAHIKNLVQEEQYYVFPGTTVTVCCLTLTNGFNVTGEAACIHPGDFDAAKGRQIAKTNAINEIWKLEGYRAKQAIHEEAAE